METKKKSRSDLFKMIQILITAALFGFVLAGCSKDDDGGDGPIKAQKTTVTIDGVNNCSTSLGDGTILSLVTPYVVTDGLVITKIRLKATVSNGESEESTTTNFTDTGSTIELEGCFTFGSQQWVEYELRLEVTGGLLSNPSTIRVNKPIGAN